LGIDDDDDENGRIYTVPKVVRMRKLSLSHEYECGISLICRILAPDQE
jgi:hypothetical protein